ncbi:MAG: D-glycero-alpha-D-manno-heptose-1,7-bisphosphate 7-phosphatase [Ginsengibacter sp.]|jgi:D,D-heptose 1,7-bisphosphate phosphatase
MNKAVFIDKDGTLIKNIPYNVKPELVEFEDGAFESLLKLQKIGYKLIIISNQPGVALGYFKEKELKSLVEKLKELLSEKEIKLDGFYYCPHAENDNCNCRKPKPGLLLSAAQDHQVDLSASWMIGDILNDVEAGNRAGCKSILIDNGNETEWIWGDHRKPNFVVKDWRSAVEIILLQSI